MDTTQILTKVLTIIDYQDDKQQFIDQFSSQCIRLAIITAIDSLPKEKKDELLKQINSKQSLEETRGILQKYISEKSFQEYVMQTSQKQFEDYIETIIPKLTQVQKSTLLSYLAQVGK